MVEVTDNAAVPVEQVDIDRAREAWNSLADQHNQWDHLSLDERDAWARSYGRHRLAAEAAALEKGDALREACEGIGDDYMTSDKHHPGYVLIPAEKFDAILSVISADQGGV